MTAGTIRPISAYLKNAIPKKLDFPLLACRIPDESFIVDSTKCDEISQSRTLILCLESRLTVGEHFAKSLYNFCRNSIQSNQRFVGWPRLR